jgi:beta-glucosidase
MASLVSPGVGENLTVEERFLKAIEFEEQALKELLAILTYKPTIVCLNLDRPAVIPEIAEKASSLLAAFGASDSAILDILFGKFIPTGKLPFDLPSSMEAVYN